MNTTIKQLPKNDTFVRINKNGSTQKTVYSRGEYCRLNKKYECTSIDDINKFIYLKGSATVQTIDV